MGLPALCLATLGAESAVTREAVEVLAPTPVSHEIEADTGELGPDRFAPVFLQLVSIRMAAVCWRQPELHVVIR